MKFSEISAGTDLFIDANTFIYYFAPDPLFGSACSSLLDRIENKELTGVTSASVLAEVSHRLMTVEAHQLFGWPNSGMAHRLKRHPTEVQQLSRYRQAIDEIRTIGVQVLPVEGIHVSRAADFSQQYGLLTNDALLVVLMQAHSLSHLASLDADFDRVPGITRYSPI